MIQLSAAGKRYGHKLLFEGVDWLITSKDRIGLVGANGTGKSTLMKVLARTETLDYGSISTAKGISAGYLPDRLALSGQTVFAECMSVFSKLRAMEQEMEDLTRSMSELDHTSAEYAQVAERYQRIEHEFRTRDGYAIEAQVGAVISGLGFRKEDWGRQKRISPAAGKCESLSPSSCWKSRIFCCSTSPPTTSISKPETGWSLILKRIRMPTC